MTQTAKPKQLNKEQIAAIERYLESPDIPLPLAIGLETTEERAQIINVEGQHVAYVEIDPVPETAQLIVQAVNSFAAFEQLLEAARKAEKLAWEVGSETEDGIKTILADSRGDLWRELTDAIAAAEAAKKGT